MTANWSGNPKTWGTEVPTPTQFNTEIRDRFDLLKLLADDDGTPSFFQFSRVVSVFNATSTTDLANVGGLAFDVKANEQWMFVCFLHVAGDTSGDLKLGVSFPQGAAGRYGVIGRSNSPNDPAGELDQMVDIHTVDNEDDAIILTGTVVNSGNAGTIQFQAAQVTANGNPTTIYAGSFIFAMRL